MSFPKHHTHLELALYVYHFQFGEMPLNIATSNDFYPVPWYFFLMENTSSSPSFKIAQHSSLQHPLHM